MLTTKFIDDIFVLSARHLLYVYFLYKFPAAKKLIIARVSILGTTFLNANPLCIPDCVCYPFKCHHDAIPSICVIILPTTNVIILTVNVMTSRNINVISSAINVIMRRQRNIYIMLCIAYI